MAVPTTTVEVTINDVAAGVPEPVALQVYDLSWVKVRYGSSKQLATVDDDYTLSLSEDYATVTVTPLADLIAKIEELDEGNVIYVSRSSPFTSDFTENDAQYRRKIATAFDKAAMRDQELNFAMTQETSAIAAEAAARAAADIVLQGNIDAVAALVDDPSSAVRDFATRAAIAAATIPDGINYMRASGYAAHDDKGGALYVIRGSDPGHPGSFQTANGKWVEICEFVLTPQMFGAVGDGVTTVNTDAFNDMADCARAQGVAVHIPAVPTYYTVDDTLDFSDIQHIDWVGEVRGEFDAIPGCIIGGVASILAFANISVNIRNTLDKSIVAGTYGVKVLGLGTTVCKFTQVRGFDVGVYFDGVSAVRNWVDNAFDVISFYNNGSHVHIDLDSTSYMVHNHFQGGRYYLGTNQKAADRGLFKLTAADTSLISELIVDGLEIGIDGGSAHATHATFVQANITSSATGHSMFVRNARLEAYGTYADNIHAVRLTGTGEMTIDIEAISISSGDFSRLKMELPDLTRASISFKDLSNRPQSGTNQIIQLTPVPFEPYQVNGRLNARNRLLYDATTSFAVNPPLPVPYITAGVGSVNVALGDGRVVMSSANNFIGHLFKRTVTSLSQALFLKTRLGRRSLAVICFDANGNVLGGTSPYYAKGGNTNPATIGGGSVPIYEMSTDWVWLHQDVISFAIGEMAWVGATVMYGLTFEQTYGAALAFNNSKNSAPNFIGHSAEIQSFFPVGMAIDGVASNGWRSTFSHETTVDVAAIATATQVSLDDATGVTVGDRIAIELDTAIITGVERRFHHTSVSGVGSAPLIDITNALPAGVAIGRRVLLNRWTTR